jgi:hypothetical protein
VSTPSIDELTRSSSFIFLGTVELRGASNLVAVDPRDDLVLVRVDRALRIDSALGDVHGKTVTVETQGGDELQPGVQAVFFTQSWIHAEEIAVREVARLGPETAGEVADAVAQLPDVHLADRLARAVAVVEATVQDTQLVPGIPRDRSAPLWAEATLAVESTIKGSAEGLRLFFPTSDSHHWYRTPSFAAGQHGIFLLHSGDPLAAEWLDAVNGRENVVTALDPADVQADSELDRVRSLLGSGGG